MAIAIMVAPQSPNKCGFTACPTLRVARLQPVRRSTARKNVAVGLAHHVMVESFNQLKKVDHKIWHAGKEIGKRR
jgi:hypothetical protein